MCGICGIFSKSGMPDLKDRVLTMREQLVHRGPDSAGLFVAHDGGLGVRRLSIVDIEGSDQPLYNEDKSIVMVYNGMIYNFKELRAELQAKGHRFTTNGDGEVIIHLFEQEGIRGLGRLNGMFAIALYDLRHSDLFLVRDQIGIKPLYVAEKNGMVCFASEVKAILAADVFSPTLNSRSIELFLAYNYIPGNGTLYKEIVALKQGHYLCRNAKGDITVEQYWAVEDNAAVDAGHSEAEVPGIVERLNGLFAESIERHLIADVEVGCFLSGGLDSSALVHYMEMNPRGRLKTFTVGYDDPSYDERQFARAVTKKYDTEHIEMLCSERDVVNFLEALPRIGDMPIGDQASVSTFLVSKLAHDHVKVCLSGEGGDEIFAGYPTYSANELYPMFDRLPDALLRFLLYCVNMIPASDRKVGFDYKAKRFFEGVLLHDIAKAHAYWRVIVPPHERTKLLKNVMQEDAYAVYYDLLYDKGRSAESRALADLTTWLPNNNLMRADIFSMCNSLEVRVPLLDLPLVQYMLRIPFAIRFKNGRKKYLLKKVLEDKLERRLIHRKKAGWHMPLAPWLKKGLYTYCADTFSSHHALFDTILKRDHCLSLLNEHKRGMQNNSFKLWGILVLLKHTA